MIIIRHWICGRLYMFLLSVSGMLYVELGNADPPVLTPHNDSSPIRSDVDVQAPPAKKVCSLFAHYRRNLGVSTHHQAGASIQQQLGKYLDMINDPNYNPDETSLVDIFKMDQFRDLRLLFQRILCVPATSAPVERVFSKSGIIMRPHRARLSDTTLETLMFLRCNYNL